MTRWEYLQVIIHPAERAQDVLNPFGKEGWEAVGITMCFTDRVVLMKREIEDDGVRPL
jgi:hypothetical protein